VSVYLDFLMAAVTRATCCIPATQRPSGESRTEHECSECRAGFYRDSRAACCGQLRHQTEHAIGRRSTGPIVDIVGDLARINYCGQWRGFVQLLCVAAEVVM
jgi:hypothetical protein